MKKLSSLFLLLFLGLSISLSAQEAVKKSKLEAEPVPKASITAEIWNEIQQKYTSVLTSKTDHIGTYHFKNLKSGRYRFITVLPGKFHDWEKKSAIAKSDYLYALFNVDGNVSTTSPITFGSKTGKNPLRFISREYYFKEELNDVIVSVSTSVNNYGINDDGIKALGEPVPGAEIYVELEPDDEPIANVTSDQNGEFYFTTTNPPSVGNFVFIITPSKAFALKHKLSLTKKIKMRGELELMNDGVFRGVLLWVEDKAENKGAFAVSMKKST